MKYLLTIIILIGLISCKIDKYAVGTSKRYFNLKGPVKFVSNKTTPMLFDSNWVINIDSAILEETEYKNLFFNKNGIISRWEAYNMDSVRLQYHEYIYSNSVKLEMINIYKDEKLSEFVKDCNQRKSFLKTKTYENTSGKLTIVYKIIYDDYKVVKKIIHNKIDLSRQIINFEYDSSGNVIKMTRRSDYYMGDEILLYKYLGFDNFGNWTKRIFYDPDDYGNGSMTIRRILYE